MVQQLRVPPPAAITPTGRGGVVAVAPDLGYRRILMVNVVFCGAPDAGDRGWVLIDTGLPGSAGAIRRAAAARYGARARPSAIILTHGHFDHVGAVKALATEWEVPVYAHPLEHPYLTGDASYPRGDARVGGGMMAALAPLYPRRPIRLGRRLLALPEDGNVPEMPGWRWIHTPGHSVGHVSLWREGDRALVAGDAIVTTAQESLGAVMMQSPELHGPPKYYTVDWAAAAASAAMLAELRPEIIVSGHGPALHGSDLPDILDRLAAEFATVAVPAHGRYRDHPAFAADGSAYPPA